MSFDAERRKVLLNDNVRYAMMSASARDLGQDSKPETFDEKGRQALQEHRFPVRGAFLNSVFVQTILENHSSLP